MKHKPSLPFVSTPQLTTINKEIKFKVLDIIEKKLATELETQLKQEYELVEILHRQGPGPYSDETVYKVLLRSVK